MPLYLYAMRDSAHIQIYRSHMNSGGRAERAHTVLMSGGERLELGALFAREGS